MARRLLDGRDDLREERVCFLVPPGLNYVAAQWGIWRAGGVAVPLAVSHPSLELARTVEDADPVAVVVHPSFLERVEGMADRRGLRLERTDVLLGGGDRPGGDRDAAGLGFPDVAPARRAMMLYTSGTTGAPKGVVTTHANLAASVESLVEAWGWTSMDHILLVLPLHHVHGIVNVLTTALWCGACCQVLPRFGAEAVWERFARGDLTLFMAVPTIYRRLIRAWDEADEETRRRWSEGAATLRLMVSGSAALPVPTLERWEAVTGQRLLERYGMTEIGMALSNPLRGERRPGHVGAPLPGVEVRTVDEEGGRVEVGEPGELEVRGPGVFLEYWRRPDETRAAFRDGWFRTGDEVVLEDGAYRVLGRRSVDILKTGGYKVSALEIEDVLRTHPGVLDCAVVGVEDEEWGERVCAAVVPEHEAGEPETPASLRAWARERLAPYKVPRDFLLLDELPRNALGKVTKPEVRALFEGRSSTSDVSP